MPLEVYEKVVNLDVLIELLVTQSNLYSQLNGHHFITNPEEMKAFLGTNYVMALNQLPNISMYWDCDHFIGNNDIQNIFTGGRYKEILKNLQFADNSKQVQTNKGYKICPIINHLNKSFQESYLNEPEQSIDDHMTKFKGPSSMRQYLKVKPIKWGFKWWFRYASSNGYLYEFDLYFGKKQNVEVDLGEDMVMHLSEKLKGTFCTLFFDNFFNSPLLINKLFEENIM